jgi:hypothetical protein
MFMHLLGPKSFDNPKGPLAHKQTFLLITFNGIGLISTTIIALVAYLGSWALVASIIIAKLMVHQHPFLLETLARVDNNTFLFQQHLKATCNLLLSLVRACLPLFE